MNKRVIWLILLLSFSSSSLIAQLHPEPDKGINSELSLVWGIAQGSFGDNLDRPIPGVLLSFGGQTPKLPLILSTEFGWFNYGFDNYAELRFSDDINSAAPPLSAVSIETSNSILMAHLVARVAPLEGMIVPYIDGLVGFKYFLTKVAIESEAIFEDDDLITIIDDDQLLVTSAFNSLATSFGIGTGINIRIFDGPLGMHNRNRTILLHLGARYLLGSEADYLTENSILPETDRIFFEQVESDTDMLIPKLGVQVKL